MASSLLNEFLTSTNPGESLYITQVIVRILYRLGARAVFATTYMSWPLTWRH
jgi:hypothetical protein